MDKVFTCIDQEGNEVMATFSEAKEKGYTIAVDSITELKDYLSDDVAFTIKSANTNEEVSTDGEFLVYGDGEVSLVPDDPSEGEEGFDDKMSYTE